MPAGWIAQASILKEFNDEMAPFGPRPILLEAYSWQIKPRVT